jgi:hypothetical protein
MKELTLRTLSSSDFLNTDTIEVKNHKCEGDIEGWGKTQLAIYFRVLKFSKGYIYMIYM